MDRNPKGYDLWPWSFVLSRQQHDEQQAWFEAELAKPRTTPFLAVAAHHPLYSNGKHRDNPMLIAPWDSLLRRHNVDLYLSVMITSCSILSSKVIPRHLSSPVEEGRSSSAGPRRPRSEDHGLFAR